MWNWARGVLVITGSIHTAVWVGLTVDGVHTIADTYRPAGAATATAQVARDSAHAPLTEVQIYLFLVATALVTAVALLWSDLPVVPSVGRTTPPRSGPVTAAAPLRFTHFSDHRRRIVGGGWGAALLYFALIVVAQDLRIVVELVTGYRAIPAPADRSAAEPTRLVEDFVTSIGAGVWEELALLALPIALLTLHGCRTRRRLLVIIGVVMVLRAGIHLYYGTGSIMVIPWMTGAVLLYTAVGSIWPLVVAHALFDLWVSIINRLELPPGPAQITQHLVVVAGLVTMWQSVRRAHRQHQRTPGHRDPRTWPPRPRSSRNPVDLHKRRPRVISTMRQVVAATDVSRRRRSPRS